MHKGVAERAAVRHAVTQDEADQCCASSERKQSGPSAQFSAISLSIAIVPVTLHAVEPVPVTLAMGRHLTELPSVLPVARHVLLSVFLL